MDKAILIGLDLGKYNIETSLEELENIANALNIKIVERFVQRLAIPDIRTYVGSGKVLEIKEAVTHLEASMVIFDDEQIGRASCRERV